MDPNLQEIIEDLALDLPEANLLKLKLLCKKAATQIINYLNITSTVEQVYIQYQYALEQIVLDTYNYQNTEQFKNGAVMIKEGNSSIQYNQQSSLKGRVIFSEEVEKMLPKPFIKLM